MTGQSLSIRQAYDLARSVGLSGDAAVNAVAVGLAESNLYPGSVGDVQLQTAVWGPSIGIWQIRSLKAQAGTGGVRDATRLPDPKFNAKAMASISNKGNDWTPWSTWNNGSARINVSTVRQALGDTTAAPSATRGSDVGGTTSSSAPLTGTVLGANGQVLATGVIDPGGLIPGAEKLGETLGGAVSGLGGAVGGAVGDAVGGVADQVAEAVTTALLSTVVWAAAFGLGATLIAIGAYRTVSK